MVLRILGIIDIALTIIAIYCILSINKKAMDENLAASINCLLVSVFLFLILLSLEVTSYTFELNIGRDLTEMIDVVIVLFAVLALIASTYKMKKFAKGYRLGGLGRLAR